MPSSGKPPALRLFDAVKDGDRDAVDRELTMAPDLVYASDRYLKTALHLAAEHDRDAIARRLLDEGADVEAETTWGMTPLQWAANMGHVRTARVLLDRGARLNMWSAAGLGMIDVLPRFWDASGRLVPGAAQVRYDETAKDVFVKRPTPPDDHDAVSDAFYIACRNGHTSVARLLLDRGADVHFKGFFGGTALHWAAINGHAETVEFLLAHGARTDAEDDQFHSTPAGWAHEGGHMDVVARLTRA